MEKKKVISFHILESEYEPYREALERSKISRSEFFRKIFLEKKSKIVFNIYPKGYDNYLYFINQIFNSLQDIVLLLKKGNCSEKQYSEIVKLLNIIRLLLQYQLR
jgi:hypothetical protein